MLKDLLSFIVENKKWWLIPIAVVILIFGLLIATSTAIPVSPMLYMLF